MGYITLCQAYSLDKTFGKQYISVLIFHIKNLIFQRRAAAIQYKYNHDFIFKKYILANIVIIRQRFTTFG